MPAPAMAGRAHFMCDCAARVDSAINLNHWKLGQTAGNGQCDQEGGVPDRRRAAHDAEWSTIMSEIADPQSKPKPSGAAAGQRRVLAQIEKWMETIREISREQSKT